MSDRSNEMIDVDEHIDSSGRDSGLSNGSPSRLLLDTSLKEKCLSSHKELQEAKQKLEELRLLRFEEKSVLKQEIDHLNEKYGEEERNSSNLEKQLKKYAVQKMVLDQKIMELEKEQTISAQINTMQEQEIVHLEMKSKDEEMQRHEVSRQLDQLRKTVVEKDKQRMKQQSEIILLKDRVSQLDESNVYYKNTADGSQQKVWEIEAKNHSLNDDILRLKSEVEEGKTEIARLASEVKHGEMQNRHLKEETEGVQKDIQEMQASLDFQISRCETLEVEHRKRETLLQKEIDRASFSESTYKEKYERAELLFREIRREKEEQLLDLKRVTESVRDLEEQVREIENQKTETDALLAEFRTALSRRVRCDEDGALNEEVLTVEEVEDYFTDNDSKTQTLQDQIANLSQQVEEEQAMVVDLTSTIQSVRMELLEAQTDLESSATSKESLQQQYEKASETLKLHETSMEKQCDEIARLKEMARDLERQNAQLLSDVRSLNADVERSATARNEEEGRVLLKIRGFEDNIQHLEKARRCDKELHVDELNNLKQKMLREREMHTDELNEVKKTLANENESHRTETSNLKEVASNQLKEIKDLKYELEILAEDNKNLVQRLAHLESYSNKLSEMLDKTQNLDDKAREKAQSEIREYKAMLAAKDEEIIETTGKVSELNDSLNEEMTKQEQLEKQLGTLTNIKNVLEKENEEVKKEKAELERKLETTREANLSAEHAIARHLEDNQDFEKKCEDQAKLIEEMQDRVKLMEDEKVAMKESAATMERGIRLKESVIAELSRRAGETTENVSSLKSSIQKTEADKRHFENKLSIFRQEKTLMEKKVREYEEEKSYLRDQVANLQRLLAKAEDEKERSLGHMTHYKSQLEARTTKEKSSLKDLESKVKSLRGELDFERQRRERVEARYTKRGDQVDQLRSTFDHSLDTISKDTKNIKSIIGKSLKKIDRIQDGEVSDSAFADSDSESFVLATTLATNVSPGKYLSLPSHRSKSSESPVEALNGKYKAGSPTTPRKYKHSDLLKSPPVSSSPASKLLSLIPETPPSRETPSYRKMNKRLSR